MTIRSDEEGLGNKEVKLDFIEMEESLDMQASDLSARSLQERENESKESDALKSDSDIYVVKSECEEQRFRCLEPEDKEDILEFIFLDLTIELYQEPCLNNRFMDAINDYVQKMKRQAAKKKGVKTSLSVVKEYLRLFVAFINSNACLT